MPLGRPRHFKAWQKKMGKITVQSFFHLKASTLAGFDLTTRNTDGGDDTTRPQHVEAEVC
jgi:hypothetical protein